MNNIVNDLIEKADKWSCEEYNYKETGYTREQLYSQKLAELIVKGCADVGSYYGGNVKHLILSHFGVEE